MSKNALLKNVIKNININIGNQRLAALKAIEPENFNMA